MLGWLLYNYITAARDLVSLEEGEEKLLKAAVIEKGGVRNSSCLFLKNTSGATIVNSTTGVSRKMVMKIKRTHLPEEMCSKLDTCKFLADLLMLILFIHYLFAVCSGDNTQVDLDASQLPDQDTSNDGLHDFVRADM